MIEAFIHNLNVSWVYMRENLILAYNMYLKIINNAFALHVLISAFATKIVLIHRKFIA